MSTEQKDPKEENKKDQNKELKKTSTIIETTYEKVLSIINKVKEFIKKSSSNAQNLIDDLEWVIKVITNKSLYTYELKQEELSKQNAEYNTFINFVTKYNEEVLEMNRKHDIVNSIFNLGKKGDMLHKPSLCLKKIMPDELKNMNEDKKWLRTESQKNFINVFGNQILNLYNQEMEKRKRRNNCEFIENSECILSFKKNNIQCDEESECSSSLERDNNNNNGNNNNTGKISKISKNQNMNNLKKNENKDNKNTNRRRIKKVNTSVEFGQRNYNHTNNIKKIKLIINKDKKALDNSKLKSKKNNNINKILPTNIEKKTNYSLKKLYGGSPFNKSTKNEKITLNNIKKGIRNYIKYEIIDLPNTNVQQFIYKNNNIINNYNNRYLYKTNYNININYNNNYDSDFNRNQKNNVEKGFMIYKTYQNGAFPYSMPKIQHKYKSKHNNKKSIEYNSARKNMKNLNRNLMIFNLNEDRFKIFNNNSYKYYLGKNNNNISKNKNFLKRLQITAENKKNPNRNNNKNILQNNIYNLKTKSINLNSNKYNSITRNENNIKEITNTNTDKSKNDNIKEEINENNNNIEQQKENNDNIKELIDKYYSDIKLIIDKDFNIFDFQKKVGYKNVLPIMGFIILKTLGLVETKIISVKKLDSFLFNVSNNYKQTTLYHNSLHGADVTQSICCYFLNSNIEEICETSVLDLLGMIVSAMGHDLGHPGLNNNFHINDKSELAITYNDASVLENFHSSFLFKILRKEENNIIEKFSNQDFKTLRKRMISQILATDMANHGEVVSLIRSKIKSWKEYGNSRFNLLSGNEKTKFNEQQSLLNYIIHMADLGHNCKKFEISLEWVRLLSMEFWDQGDKEKEKGLPVSFLCDRDKVDIPSSQIGFIKGFILSSFDCLVNIFPKLKYTTDNAEENINQWKRLKEEKRYRGWTPEKERKNNDDDEKNEK